MRRVLEWGMDFVYDHLFWVLIVSGLVFCAALVNKLDTVKEDMTYDVYCKTYGTNFTKAEWKVLYRSNLLPRECPK